jgi:nicotinamidase-related amidase
MLIDMVSFFVANNPYGPGIVPHINRLAKALRSAGGAVVWMPPKPAAPSRWVFRVLRSSDR